MHLRLATRGSALALAQSNQLADRLRDGGHTVELVRVRTLGDVSTAPLDTLGGAGVFAAAVREAVVSGDCQLAVHSFKDLPTQPHPGLTVVTVPTRASSHDVLCARDGLGLSELPGGSRVGTGSARRSAQLVALRPDLDVVGVRGNIDTRLGFVASGELDAVVLAEAGLQRLGRTDAITHRFDFTEMLPAPAQGALAIECASDADPKLLAALSALDDPDTRRCCDAERTMMRIMEAGCSAPVGALGRLEGDLLTLTVTSATPGPLTGRRILMPQRPDDRLGAAVALAGARVTIAEFTRTVPDLSPRLPEVLAALKDNEYDWLAVTSASTVRTLDRLGISLADQVGPGVRVAATGDATARVLRKAGLRVSLVPDLGTGGAALADAWPEGAGRVLLLSAAEPSPSLSRGLATKGWATDQVSVYRVETANALPPSVLASWDDGFDAFVGVSGSSVAAAARLFGHAGPPVVALGPSAVEAARANGWRVAAVSESADPDALVDALSEAFKEPR